MSITDVENMLKYAYAVKALTRVGGGVLEHSVVLLKA